jgi:hypothetical protein
MKNYGATQSQPITEVLDFLNSIEGAGYGGMASFEIARAHVKDMASHPCSADIVTEVHGILSHRLESEGLTHSSLRRAAKAVVEHITGVAPSSPAVDGAWQPIETAPKDGTHFLTIYGADDDGTYWIVFWNDNWLECVSSGFQIDHATHWQPLPTPPMSSTQPPCHGPDDAFCMVCNPPVSRPDRDG